MSAKKDQNARASRDQARARLRTVTSAALFATTGATVGIAIVVAHEHPGKSAATTTSGESTGGTTGTTGSSGKTGNNTGDTGDTGSSTGNTGNSGASSFSPSITSRTPSVTSGGSSR